MIVQPKEFLNLSHQRGFTNGIFKQAMCHITENLLPVHVAKVQGKQLYFSLCQNEAAIRYMLGREKEVHESEQIFTEAFSLLKIIAD